MKKTFTILLAGVLLTLVATPALAAPRARIDLKTKRTAAVVEGDTAWVALTWTAGSVDATDFRVVATSSDRGISISYPETTGDYSSLMADDTLSSGEIDFTSLQVSVPYGSKNVKLTVVATWTTDGERQTRTYKVKVPVARFKGDDIAQSTDDVGSVGVGTASELGEASWLGIEWTGIAPIIENVRMTVKGPADLTITYPDEGSFTSLQYDDTLLDGETDIARIRVDTSSMGPGSYTLDVLLSYTKGTDNLSVIGTVAFEVAG
ncbi:MAG: hypothetical protein BMS9Abin12_0742 [Acidimicrobiia bacterium]|nr:MAG: hypothetical protein BMS9Abin12_0742 [Acidimicrobiia bacterium]